MIGRAVVPYSILVQLIDLFDYQKYAIRLICWVCNDIWLLPRNLIGSISHLWYANLEYNTKNNQYSYALFYVFHFWKDTHTHTHISANFISIMNFVIWVSQLKWIFWSSLLAIAACNISYMYTRTNTIICQHVQTNFWKQNFTLSILSAIRSQATWFQCGNFKINNKHASSC